MDKYGVLIAVCDTGSMVELINPQKLPTDHTQNANGLQRKRITRRLALIFHAHRCTAKDKSSVKNCGTIQAAVSTLHVVFFIRNKVKNKLVVFLIFSKIFYGFLIKKNKDGFCFLEFVNLSFLICIILQIS